jgi:CDP-paratose 2-epimerase
MSDSRNRILLFDRRPAVLITGGAGFIGTNLAHRLASSGYTVYIFDSLARPNVERNIAWLLHRHHDCVQVEIGDVRDRDVLRRLVPLVDHVFHLAAQVAVTTSVEKPLDDFTVNVVGTLNLLEEIRSMRVPPSLLYTSTNKVYGALDLVPLGSAGKRYIPSNGCDAFDESYPLSFHSPYGCSKGAAEQYVLDYWRTYGIRTVVFRMSCIYGPHQFGTEDQGWVAHIMSRALAAEPVTVYGDGMQVRDILFVDDLANAMTLAQEQIHRIAGNVFNIGGGPENTISLLEFLDILAKLNCRPLIRYGDWRIGDQRYYVSDTRRFRLATGWQPKTSVLEGLNRLRDWLMDVQDTVPAKVLT